MANIKDFHFTEFDGIVPDVYRGYVIFNTARHAWEAEMFEFRYVPKGWKRKVVLSLTGQHLIVNSVLTLVVLI
jgi:hypothetical protein